MGFYDIPALLPPYKSTGDWARLIRHCAAYLSGLRPVSLIRRQQKTPETVSLRSLLWYNNTVILFYSVCVRCGGFYSVLGGLDISGECW